MSQALENLKEILKITDQMMRIAETGNQNRNDTGCGVLYGVLRNEADRIRLLAVQRLDELQSRIADVEKKQSGSRSR